jgi:serine/threonine protein kinase
MGQTAQHEASLIGKRLGNYAVKALIGTGAMGVVYLARDVVLGRWVALKVLLGSLAQNPDYIKRFQMEARAAAPLRHPNIVAIYESGIRHGIPFIAMEYVEGESLERFLKRKQTLKWQNALYIAQQIADALECAHQAGIVHRDVKPSNIMLDRYGCVRLTDFGIANVHREDEPDIMPGQLFGTPAWMSPEQCGSESGISAASDLFSLGVIVYRMLSGKMPFDGHTREALINSITSEEPRRLNQIMIGIPDDVARLTAYLLEKPPGRRPASARAVSMLIHRLQRENGGASAMPAALKTFIREETEPRRYTPETPTPAASGKRLFKTKSGDSKGFFSVTAPIRLAALFLLAAGLAGTGYGYFARGQVNSGPPPRLPESLFSREEPGVARLDLPHSAWQAERIHWAGGRDLIIASITGRPQTAASGDAALLALDLETGAGYSLRAPAGPVRDAFWPECGLPVWGGVLPVLRQRVPWRECVLTSVRGSGAEPGVFLLAQGWEEAQPRRNALCRLPLTVWDPAASSPWIGIEAGRAIICPGGDRLCLVLYDPEEKYNYLTEYTPGKDSSDTLPPPLTPPGDPILPASVRYTPAGGALLFQRRKTNGEIDVCAVSTGVEAGACRRLATGNYEEAMACSPDGRLILLTERDEADTARLRLIRVDTGETAGEAGPGCAGCESWHTAGRRIAITAADENGVDQIWLMESRAPWRREAVTALADGALSAPALSRDGRYAAVIRRGRLGDQLLVFTIDENTLKRERHAYDFTIDESMLKGERHTWRSMPAPGRKEERS